MSKFQKNLLAPALALKRIFRPDSGRDHGEQALVLERLHAQMQDSKKKILEGEPEAPHS